MKIGLTPEVIKAASKATGAPLDTYAAQLREEFAQYDMAERDAAIRALRIGLLLEQVKEQLPHGAFVMWRDSAVTAARERQCRYFMQLARRFIAERNLGEKQVQALCTGAQQSKSAQQLLLDFIGGRSQAEMMDQYGIKLREPKPTGGARPGAGRPRSDGKPDVSNIRRQWMQWIQMTHGQAVQHMTWQFLEKGDLEAIEGLLHEFSSLLKAHIREM